jgi:hypothetical protein
MAGTTAAGEQKAWELLASLRPEDVVRKARVTFDAASASYTIRSFGIDFTERANDHQSRPKKLSAARTARGFFPVFGPVVSGECEGI